jgi:hypothetical protein
MPEMSKVEQLVLGYIEKARTIHVDKLFEAIRGKEYVPFTDTQIVSAIWSLKDRRKIEVTAEGDLKLIAPAAQRIRQAVAM